MGQFYDEIPESLATWIENQRMFWIATAPLTGDGLVNVSPKGLQGTFHVVNSRRVWYEDLTGSTMESSAHLRENGRITILFNAFEGPPKIARLYGKGVVHEFGTSEYDELIPPEQRQPGSRAAIVIDVFKVGTNCGFAVPFFSFQGDRSQLHEWAIKKEDVDRAAYPAPGGAGETDSAKPTEGGMKAWWAQKNSRSLDGLPSMLAAHTSNVPFPGFNPVTSLVQVFKRSKKRDTNPVPSHLGVNGLAQTDRPFIAPVSPHFSSSQSSIGPTASSTSHVVQHSPTPFYDESNKILTRIIGSKHEDKDFGRAIAFVLGIIMTISLQRVILSVASAVSV